MTPHILIQPVSPSHRESHLIVAECLASQPMHVMRPRVASDIFAIKRPTYYNRGGTAVNGIVSTKDQHREDPMELQRYWLVLVRRRNVIRNTFLLVAFLSLVTVTYTAFGSQYRGAVIIGVQMRPNPIKNASIDPDQAANANTGPVEDDLTTYAGTVDYFKAVSQKLKDSYHIDMGWRTVAQGLQIFESGAGHSIHIEQVGSNSAHVVAIVTAAADRLRAYVPVYHDRFHPHSPLIDANFLETPASKPQGLTKPLTDLLLRLVLGLAAGIVLAYLFEYLDSTIKDESDVEHIMRLPVLAVIPGSLQGHRVRKA